MKLSLTICLAALAMAAPASGQPTAPAASPQIEGLWKAERVFGPRAKGPLLIRRLGERMTADFVGRRIEVREAGGELVFALPGGEGEFHGKTVPGGAILGLWRQSATVSDGRFESPVRLRRVAPGEWRGEVAPQEDTFTFWMRIQRRADGTFGVILRNPERDFGGQIGADRLVLNGADLQLVGGRGKTRDRVLASGRYDAANRVISLDIPGRGGTYDFTPDSDASDFYPRGKAAGAYAYAEPPALDDGLPVATPEAVGLDRTGLEAMVQHILDMPMDVASAPQVHAVLVARHGKLVLEEYFHGMTREQLHTTRSAGKSVTSVLIGAALANDPRLSLSSPVYQVMNGGAVPADLGPRKRAMTLENLITMSSGFYCNDADDAAPGNEETMTNQEAEPDYYRYTLKVPMAYEPGRVAVYCSASPNLALGMVGRTLGEDPVYSFDARVAQPLRIDHYAWGLDGVDHPYGGGSVLLRARDFLKFGQLMLNGGTWGGRRILSQDFVARATATHYRLGRYGYGYLWWTTDFPYRGGTTPAFMALGNGGQRIVVVPKLDLVVAVMAGEYATLGGYGELETVLVPRFVMAAIHDPGDLPGRPFRPADYASPEARAPIPPPDLRPDGQVAGAVLRSEIAAAAGPAEVLCGVRSEGPILRGDPTSAPGAKLGRLAAPTPPSAP